MLRAVLFDWGDTLMEFRFDEELMADAFRQGLEALGRRDLAPAEDVLRHFREQFEPLIQQAKAFAAAAKSIADVVRGIRTGPSAPGSPQDKLDLIRQEIAKQRTILLSGDPEEQLAAGQKMQELLQELLAVGEEQLDVNGPEFRALREEVIAQLEQVEATFESLGGDAKDLIVAEPGVGYRIREAPRD